MGSPSTGEIAFGKDRQLGRRKRTATMQRSGDDVAAGPGEIGCGRGDGEVESAVAEQLGEPGRAADAVGRDDDAVLVGDQLGQPLGQTLAVADHRPPSGGLHHRRVGMLGCGAERPHRLRTAEQPIGVGVQARESAICVAGPRRCQRPGQVVFFGEQVVGPVAHAPRLDQRNLARGRQQIGDQRVAIDEPRQPALHPVEHRALGEPFPLLAPPRLLGHQL